MIKCSDESNLWEEGLFPLMVQGCGPLWQGSQGHEELEAAGYQPGERRARTTAQAPWCILANPSRQSSQACPEAHLPGRRLQGLWEEAARWRESLRPCFLLHCSGLCCQLHELWRKKDMGATRTLGGLDGWCLWFWGLAFGDDKLAGLVFDPMMDNLLQSFFRKSDSMLCCAILVATLTDGHTLWLTSTRVISF